MFKIEQLAFVLNPLDRNRAEQLLSLLGWSTWVQDEVTANGHVHNSPAINVATLRFNYTAIDQCRELEVLQYTKGPHWYQYRQQNTALVSHVGMHVTEEQLAEWREKLTMFGLNVVQEVDTLQHTNPLIKDSRRYHYVIFGAAHLIGVDLKFIVRKDITP